MHVSKSDLVAMCQDYGFSTADGWDDAKLLKKFGDLLQIGRLGEFTPTEKVHRVIFADLMDAEEFEIVADAERTEGGPKREKVDDFDDIDLNIGEGDDDEDEKQEEEKDAADSGNPLEAGQRVIVHDGEKWKGVVHEILNADYVYVRDRTGELWETAVEKCEVVQRLPKKSDVHSQNAVGTKSDDPQDEEIKRLQAEVQRAKAEKKANGKGKRLNRDELSLKVLKSSPDGVLTELADVVEAKFVRRGGAANAGASYSAVKRMVKYGVLFGLMKQKGRTVSWVGSD